MMTSWRTIVNIAPPSLLAIDTKQGTGYFALDVSEGDNKVPSILRGRIAVVDQKITELELFINRNRGDHGFSFNSTQLLPNYATLMSPPADWKQNSRASLEVLSVALFATSSKLTTEPLGCSWPASHSTDDSARTTLGIDKELGFVIISSIIPVKVYPYNGNVSAFIPKKMTAAQEAQDVWFVEMKAKATLPVLSPKIATGDTLEVLQFYNGKLQAMQINIYLSGPGILSP